MGADRVLAAAAGAVAALRQLRTTGLPLALVTNTTSRPRSFIASALARAGFPVRPGIFSPRPPSPLPTYPGARCLLLNSGRRGPDAGDVQRCTGRRAAGGLFLTDDSPGWRSGLQPARLSRLDSGGAAQGRPRPAQIWPHSAIAIDAAHQACPRAPIAAGGPTQRLPARPAPEAIG